MNYLECFKVKSLLLIIAFYVFCFMGCKSYKEIVFLDKTNQNCQEIFDSFKSLRLETAYLTGYISYYSISNVGKYKKGLKYAKKNTNKVSIFLVPDSLYILEVRQYLAIKDTIYNEIDQVNFLLNKQRLEEGSEISYTRTTMPTHFFNKASFRSVFQDENVIKTKLNYVKGFDHIGVNYIIIDSLYYDLVLYPSPVNRDVIEVYHECSLKETEFLLKQLKTHRIMKVKGKFDYDSSVFRVSKKKIFIIRDWIVERFENLKASIKRIV